MPSRFVVQRNGERMHAEGNVHRAKSRTGGASPAPTTVSGGYEIRPYGKQ